jgi:hypothetical protein
MIKASRRVLVWVCILGLGALRAPCAQEGARDLLLKHEDLRVENHEDPGLHLYIRKKTDIASVMLMESVKDPEGKARTYAYRSLQWNPINGDERRADGSGEDERWSLLDSSPETHPLMDETFHIYIPPIIVYGVDGVEGSRQETVIVADGTYMNIRTFPLPYANAAQGFEDNPFTVRYSSIFPEPPVIRHPISPPPEPSAALPPEEEPAASPEAAPPEAVRTDAVPPAAARPDAVPPEAPRPASARAAPARPEKEPVVINGRFGYRAFIPGPNGLLLPSLPMSNTFNPVGAVTLTRPLNKPLAAVMEVERESVSLNRLVVRAAWDGGMIGVEAGPYLGILNTETMDISPGLSVLLRLRFPEWNLAGVFRFDSALGRVISAPGEYTLSYASAAISYAFPWLTLTLGMFERGSAVLDSQDVLRVGRWIRYNLAAEFPRAPARWAFRVEAGYEHLQWNYKLFVPLEYRNSTAYAGLEASYALLPEFLTLIAGLEGPVYPFVYPALLQSLDNPQAAFYGRITLGFRLTLR